MAAQLIAKVGSGFLFDTLYQKSGHDIAVSTESIHGIASDRTPPPVKHNVICHHLNYFTSEVGLQTLAAVDWV